MKLGPVVRFTKKMTLYECGPVSSPNYGETAHFTLLLPTSAFTIYLYGELLNIRLHISLRSERFDFYYFFLNYGILSFGPIFSPRTPIFGPFGPGLTPGWGIKVPHAPFPKTWGVF